MKVWGWWQILRVGCAAFLILVGPFLDLQVLRRLKTSPSAQGRLWFYRACSSFLLAFAAVSLVLMRGQGVWRLAPGVTERAGVLARTGPYWTMAALSMGFCAAVLTPGVVCLFSPKYQAAYTKALGKSDLSYLFPIGGMERQWWLVLSIAAGICEETIVRGFLLQVATEELRMGLLLALVVTSMAFGIGHLYQGVNGVVKTGLVGLMLACIAVVTHGLLVPMLVHAAIDMQVLAMYRRERDL
jgi:membrane protease YdiL (CAAX protease family)